jgi:dTDP-glucose pyrophosphorylase
MEIEADPLMCNDSFGLPVEEKDCYKVLSVEEKPAKPKSNCVVS